MKRRTFIHYTATGMLTALPLAAVLHDRSVTAAALPEDELPAYVSAYFNRHQNLTLEKVLLHLFPDDGDGPSATDIQALSYLHAALTDADNIADGDPEFIVNGCDWLDEAAQEHYQSDFLLLPVHHQLNLLSRVEQLPWGHNWLSLLIYYILEALLLDPVYGGNVAQSGWQWLKHQPGFPRPPAEKTYRYFQSL